MSERQHGPKLPTGYYAVRTPAPLCLCDGPPLVLDSTYIWATETSRPSLLPTGCFAGCQFLFFPSICSGHPDLAPLAHVRHPCLGYASSAVEDSWAPAHPTPLIIHHSSPLPALPLWLQNIQHTRANSWQPLSDEQALSCHLGQGLLSARPRPRNSGATTPTASDHPYATGASPHHALLALLPCRAGSQAGSPSTGGVQPHSVVAWPASLEAHAGSECRQGVPTSGDEGAGPSMSPMFIPPVCGSLRTAHSAATSPTSSGQGWARCDQGLLPHPPLLPGQLVRRSTEPQQGDMPFNPHTVSSPRNSHHRPPNPIASPFKRLFNSRPPHQQGLEGSVCLQPGIWRVGPTSIVHPPCPCSSPLSIGSRPSAFSEEQLATQEKQSIPLSMRPTPREMWAQLGAAALHAAHGCTSHSMVSSGGEGEEEQLTPRVLATSLVYPSAPPCTAAPVTAGPPQPDLRPDLWLGLGLGLGQGLGRPMGLTVRTSGGSRGEHKLPFRPMSEVGVDICVFVKQAFICKMYL